MSHAMVLPPIIQGGMGVGVSSWRLARAVSRLGQLGVVSGTGADTTLVRRLQDGDPGGHIRRVMEKFPMPQVSEAVLRKYFLPEGRAPGMPYKLLPMYRQVVGRARQQLTMLAAYVEVSLAKEGHDGLVGMNLLTKIQIPNLPSLYGAVLAGVDYILMGAGIPREIPGALDALSDHRPATLKFEVEGLAVDRVEHLTLDPTEYWNGHPPPELRRPEFLPIVASNSLATVLARKATGRVNGFIVEGPTAGGHNAPPRGAPQHNQRGEPLYGDRDVVDLDKLAELGLPFWLAGGAGNPGRLQEALSSGAAGIQVGTLFAFCEESGLDPDLRRSVLASAAQGKADVFTSARASPTGYPFKVVSWPEDATAGVPRKRVCDLGYLRTAYVRSDGKIDYRCASEPVDAFVKKGGREEDTDGRQCLCNRLMATIGQGQLREGDTTEPPIVTSGDDLVSIGQFLDGREKYSAADVISYLLGEAAS